jgi:peptidoglycan hydrolase CwlO-like protein
MNGKMNIIASVVAVIMALGSVAYSAGVVSTKVDGVSDRVDRVEQKQDEIQDIKVEQAVQGADISTLQDDVSEIKTRVDEGFGQVLDSLRRIHGE